MCAAPSEGPKMALDSTVSLTRHILLLAPIDHGLHTVFECIKPKSQLFAWEDDADVPQDGVQEVGTAKHETGDPIPFTGRSTTFVHLSGIYRLRWVLQPRNLSYDNSQVEDFFRCGGNGILIVDAIEGISSSHPYRLVQQIVENGLRPMLFINKIDRLFRELCLSPEEAYVQCNHIVTRFNDLLATYSNHADPMISVDPAQGQVLLGSAIHGWAVTVAQMSRLHKFDSNPGLLRRLWGDYWYDRETKRFTQTPISKTGKQLPRCASLVVFGTLASIYAHIGVPVNAPFTEKCQLILDTLKVPMTAQKWSDFANPMKRITYVLSRFSSVADALGELAISHMISPS